MSGSARQIQVNPVVAATAALVRDGTQAVTASATGATAFTPNPTGGPAGFSTMIGRVLDYVLGAEVQAGVSQPAAVTTGLGATGTLNAPYAPPTTLAGFASALTAAQAQERGAVATALTTETGVQTSLTTKLNAASGVSVDSEMSEMIALQNAYGANAKVGRVGADDVDRAARNGALSMTSITGFPEYGLLTRLVADGSTTRANLDTLTQQAADGYVADTYAGLGSGARISLDLTPEIAHQTAVQSSIDQTTGRLDVTQTAMTQIQSVASDLYAKLNALNGDPTSVDSLAATARSALTQVAGLLNTTDGNVYVFSGQDTANPAIPDGDNILSSGFYTQIKAAVGALSANGATATAASTLATASSNAAGTSPFSAFLSQGAATLAGQRSVVPLGDGQSAQTGLLASANAAVTSGGGSTTGSYMRDLMRALATIGSLSGSQSADSANFSALVSDTRTSLRGAISTMADDVGVLGDAETRFKADQTQIGDAQTALKTQLASTQEVDMASTLSKLTAVQTQMQASYQLIAGLSGLSLVKFLP